MRQWGLLEALTSSAYKEQETTLLAQEKELKLEIAQAGDKLNSWSSYVQDIKTAIGSDELKAELGQELVLQEHGTLRSLEKRIHKETEERDDLTIELDHLQSNKDDISLAVLLEYVQVENHYIRLTQKAREVLTLLDGSLHEYGQMPYLVFEQHKLPVIKRKKQKTRRRCPEVASKI